MNTPRTDEAFEQFEKHRNVDRLKRACRGIERDLTIFKASFLHVTHENDQLRKELQTARERIEVLLTEADAANARIKDLERWKIEQVAIEYEWNPQAVAKALGVPLGTSIRKGIAEKVPQLVARVAELEQWIRGLEEIPGSDEVTGLFGDEWPFDGKCAYVGPQKPEGLR